MTSLPLKADIFDMDGVLINSEAAWQEAEYEVLTDLGLNLNYDDILQTTGLRIDQIVSYWYQRFPWGNYNNDATSRLIVTKVVKQILNLVEQACQRAHSQVGSLSRNVQHHTFDMFEYIQPRAEDPLPAYQSHRPAQSADLSRQSLLLSVSKFWGRN